MTGEKGGLKAGDDARTGYRNRLIDIIPALAGKAPEPPDAAREGIRVNGGQEEEDGEDAASRAEDLDPYGSGG